MTTREWSTVDYYDVLGVARDASPATILTRYRALARELHPDARPADPESAERFKKVTAAYRVLGDADTRADYDHHRSGVADRELLRRSDAKTVGVGAGGQRAPRLLTTRRSARWAVAGGVVCFALGIVASTLVVALQRHDAELKRRGVAAIATVVERDGGRRLEFTTADGTVVDAKEPLKTGTGRATVGSEVDIRYDPDDPSEVVTTEGKGARNITLWIVAVKLLVGGVFFVVLGARRLRLAF